MTKRASWLAVGVVAVGLLVLAAVVWYPMSGDRGGMTIGAVLPLTGPLAFFGGPERDVLLMAAERVNGAGGVNGKPVRLIIEDSKSSAKDGVSAVQKVLLDKPAAVITALTIVSNAAQPVLKNANKLQIALSVHPTLARQSPYTIRPYYGFEDEMRAIARYLEQKDIKSLGILWVMVPESDAAINEILVPELARFGGRLVASEPYNLGESNLRPQMEKIAANNPQAILTMDFGNLMGLILKEADRLKIRERVIGGIGLFYAPPIEPVLLEGLPFAGPAFIIRGSPEFQEFSAAFKRRTGADPSYDVLYTYDAFSMLVEGLRRAGPAPDKLRQAIVGLGTFPGITGPMRIHPDGNVTAEIIMGVYRGGKMVPLEGSR